MAEYSTFSYSKLTLLQVQGARDRSGRQVELSQCSNRLTTPRSKWQNLLSRSSEYANESQELILHEVSAAFADRDMSTIMANRLVTLCRAEYRATVVWKHGLDLVTSDCQSDMEWCRKRVQEEEKGKLLMVKELQREIRKIQLEMERIRLEIKIQQLRSQIQVKHELYHEQQQEEALEEQRRLSWGSDETVCSYFMPLVLDETSFANQQNHGGQDKSNHDTTQQQGEWIEIDDDYFQASTGAFSSGWVVCL